MNAKKVDALMLKHEIFELVNDLVAYTLYYQRTTIQPEHYANKERSRASRLAVDAHTKLLQRIEKMLKSIKEPKK